MEEESETSKYNDANLSILRLHEHWLKAEEYAGSGRLIKWKFELDSIRRELFPDILRNPKRKDWLATDKKLRETIAHANTRSKLYYFLGKRHEFLRKVQDKAGKGGRYVSQYDEGFD